MLFRWCGRWWFRSYFYVVGGEKAFFLGIFDDVTVPPAVFKGLLDKYLVALIETKVSDSLLLLFLLIFFCIALLLFVFVSEAILAFLG